MNDLFWKCLAKDVSKLSTDKRRSIGVIITKDDELLSYGYNIATTKWKWFINWHKKNCLRKIFKVPKNGWYWFCPGCALSKNHAEMVAIRNIGNQSIDGYLKMYMYGHRYCCDNCLKNLEKINVKEIILYE